MTKFDDAGLLLSKADPHGTVVQVCCGEDSKPTGEIVGGECDSGTPTYKLDLVDTSPGDGMCDSVQLLEGSSTVLAQVDYVYTSGVLTAVTTPYKDGEEGGAAARRGDNRSVVPSGASASDGQRLPVGFGGR